jgi:hypothetical protein
MWTKGVNVLVLLTDGGGANLAPARSGGLSTTPYSVVI